MDDKVKTGIKNYAKEGLGGLALLGMGYGGYKYVENTALNMPNPELRNKSNLSDNQQGAAGLVTERAKLAAGPIADAMKPESGNFGAQVGKSELKTPDFNKTPMTKSPQR